MSYEEEDTCMSYEEEDTCMSYEEDIHACRMRRRIHACHMRSMSYEVGGDAQLVPEFDFVTELDIVPEFVT